MQEKIKEEIAFYKDLLKIVSAFSFGIGGGTISLLFKPTSGISLILLTLGGVLEVALLVISGWIILKIKKLLAELIDD